MTALHRTVGLAIVLGWLFAAVWGAVLWRGRAAPGRAYRRLLAALNAALGVQVVGGAVLLALGHRRPLLHYLYGAAFPLLVLLVAGALARDLPDERDRPKVLTVAALALLGLTLRAFMTGASG